jgi:hypothetical protein
MTLKTGDMVQFGRSQGEQTLGRVVKVNAKTIKVEQLESRGTMRDYRIGTIWNVAHNLVRLASSAAVPAAPVTPVVKRADAVILGDICSVYNGLSPENLHCDGEISRPQAMAKYRVLTARLNTLFRELGRKVSESEAYRLAPPLHRGY